MAKFAYKAIDKQGNKKEGEAEARDEQELKAILRTSGLIMTAAEKRGKSQPVSAQGSKKKPAQKRGLFKPKASKKEITIFARQLAVMITAGVSLLRSMTILSSQQENPAMREILSKVKDDLTSGNSLSQSMGKFPKNFDKLFVSMIKAGEASGSLEIVLKRLADHMESQEILKGKVRTAMAYPMIVLCIAIGIVFMLMSFVVPTFTKMFSEAGVKLPWATQTLVNVSNVFASYWWAMIAVMAVMGFGFVKWVNTDNGRKKFDKVILNMPLMGSFIRKVAVARFTRTMATLLDSGVPILQSFDIVSDVVGNTTMSQALMDAKSSIREGNTIARPLAESGQFPLMVTQMIEIGEESGAITAMLEKIADFNDREVNEAVDALMAALQPMIIVVLAAIIGSIVVALFMPIFSLSDIASG